MIGRDAEQIGAVCHLTRKWGYVIINMLKTISKYA